MLATEHMIRIIAFYGDSEKYQSMQRISKKHDKSADL